ncbi:hypothetical protein BU26DRAFT_517771 [Trematosphaeria pertusa]|uniref:Lytic polysaccharide monooxygenase n=1 Tax=Trematosphaeria pertusa TaxID=390896 RepID=A0A6A6IKW3_9PLEO|nr:uncharacterized protein BU26DRAFT_517771 [Trematosphaeria pertusa]KAF2251026.1 hypothetical protein BU26DRAFT_517771 [Trematosphaeria pertusa]
MKRALLSAALLATTFAVPSVTPVPVIYPGTCTMWPNWINTRDADVTGRIMFVVSSADDSALNDLTIQPQTSTSPLFVSPFPSRKVLKMYYRCINGVPNISLSSSNVTIARDMANAHLLVDAAPGKAYKPELYYHEVGGVRQEGVFLGALNQTTWGFRYQQVSCGADGRVGEREGYEVKLLGLPVDEVNPPTAQYPPDFEGFVKVIGW